MKNLKFGTQTYSLSHLSQIVFDSKLNQWENIIIRAVDFKPDYLELINQNIEIETDNIRVTININNIFEDGLDIILKPNYCSLSVSQ